MSLNIALAFLYDLVLRLPLAISVASVMAEMVSLLGVSASSKASASLRWEDISQKCTCVGLCVGSVDMETSVMNINNYGLKRQAFLG